MSKTTRTARITTKTTTTLIAASVYLRRLVISCSIAGTAWTLQIQDKASAPKIWVPAFTLTVPATGLPTIITFDDPIPMTGGIDIVTAGTTAGVVDVAAAFSQT